jgi:5-(carboxyamino)imidazole ribonucleotide synthase
MFSTRTKIGVLGGGQLGRMLGQAASPLDLYICFMDQSRSYPAGTVGKEFAEGDFNNYDQVVAFGSDKDVITIEIEHVNTEALVTLQNMGKQVHPNPAALRTIKDKGLQKQFYLDHQIPTPQGVVFDSKEAVCQWILENGITNFVQKTRSGGYDGKGVQVVKDALNSFDRLFDAPSLVEELIDIDKEFAIIAVRNAHGQVVTYPPVEMDFHPEANLVERLVCPSQLTAAQIAEAEAIARKTIQTFDICGLLAIEFFLTKSGKILVNEVAPRPHNSGHHTIDTAATSQYEQHLRGILNLPLGDTTQLRPAVMINLLGSDGHQGKVVYRGMDEALAIAGVYVHLYGKENTSPFRKMGHCTITAPTLTEAIALAERVKDLIRVEAE